MPGFLLPTGIAINNKIIYIADTGNHKIRKITEDGTVSTFAGNGNPGSSDGKGTNASFNIPNGIAVDIEGNIYIADTGNNKIRKITEDGTVSTFVGHGYFGSDDGKGTNALFRRPCGITVDNKRNVYVADTANHRIRKITEDGTVSTFAGNEAGLINGTSDGAAFFHPHGIVIDKQGNAYVSDTNNHMVRQIMVTCN